MLTLFLAAIPFLWGDWRKEEAGKGVMDEVPEKPLLFLWECKVLPEGGTARAAPAMVTSASLRQSLYALAVALATLDLAEEIRRSCFFVRFAALQATAASLLSLATFCLASYASLCLAAISVLVEARTPAQLGRTPGGAWMGSSWSLVRRARLSWGIISLSVLKLVTKVATKGSAAGTVPHLAMADVGEIAKSNVIGMAMAKEGVG
jgi:hypothetical protein